MHLYHYTIIILGSIINISIPGNAWFSHSQYYLNITITRGEPTKAPWLCCGANRFLFIFILKASQWYWALWSICFSLQWQASLIYNLQITNYYYRLYLCNNVVYSLLPHLFPPLINASPFWKKIPLAKF